MNSSFFAMISRIKYIDRWALMRNTRSENISEHSQEVAVLAHALCVIGNKRLGKSLNADRAAVIALYHDAAEIITGDMPTPVKYYDTAIREAYRRIEDDAACKLLQLLPDDLREEFERVLLPEQTEDGYLLLLIKAADKLSALIKCLEEEKAGNREFVKAEKAARDKLVLMKLPEVDIFLEEFIPAYACTLDEL